MGRGANLADKQALSHLMSSEAVSLTQIDEKHTYTDSDCTLCSQSGACWSEGIVEFVVQ